MFRLFMALGRVFSVEMGMPNMAGMVDQLVEILDEQSTRYEELLGLSLEKRDVIIANDVEMLQKINHLENLVISQNQKLEKKRQEVVTDMALVLNQKEAELTLSRLIELMEGQEEQQALVNARDKIKKVLEELKEVNKHNGELVQNALEYIEYSTNLMRSSTGQTAYFPGSDDPYIDETGYIDAKN